MFRSSVLKSWKIFPTFTRRCLNTGSQRVTSRLQPSFELPILQQQLQSLRLTSIVPQTNPKNEVIDIPLSNKIIENPLTSLINEITEIIRQDSVEAPTTNQNQRNVIRAARLIVIRRRMMRKHKLKKLRKKMKFEWAKVRQRREMRKEKAFQAELITQIKVAEKFSAEEYVNMKLKQANETPIPRYWKGRRLPQFIIKQKLGIK